MPNRILKDSICTSDKISSLSDFEFRVWTALILLADDAGRGDARPAIIKGRAFPLRERVTSKDIDAAVHGLAGKGCISLYSVGGKPYFYFPTWSEHQRVRDVKAKYPAPPEASSCEIAGSSPQLATVCGNPPQLAANRGRLRPESESESEYESESNPNPNDSSVPCDAAEPTFIEFPLNDGSMFPIFERQIADWKALYPAVDVEQQLRNMRGWLDGNPTKRKTRNGVVKFVTSWLSREQDKGGSQRFSRQESGAVNTRTSGNVFLDLLKSGVYDDQ